MDQGARDPLAPTLGNDVEEGRILQAKGVEVEGNGTEVFRGRKEMGL